MSRPQDYFGNAPKTVLNKPFMHVQDQKPSGTDGGTPTTGDNDRDLNTVLTNEINGSSLNATTGIITLPAGTYYIEALTPFDCDTNPNKFTSKIEDTSGNVLLKGPNRTGRAVFSGMLDVSGKFTITVSTDIKIVHQLRTAITNGFGSALGTFITVPYEVYTDLKIWQLDAEVKTPVLINDKLYPLPGTTQVTGNMHGLEYAKTAANQVTVQPGICMDSTNQDILSLSTATALAIPTALNTVYNLFLCKETTGGAMVLEHDTDVDGANISTDKDGIRWIGFVRNNGSGVLMDFRVSDDIFAYMKPSETVVVTGFSAASFTLVDISGMVPVSRISEIYIGPTYGADSVITFSLDGTNATTYTRSLTNQTDIAYPWGFSQFQSIQLRQIPIVNGVIYAKSGGSVNLGIAQVKLRR